jgi:hypothetical protein
VNDEDEAPSLRRGFGAWFWAMIAFGFLAAIAGAVVAFEGPRLFPKPPAAQLGKAPPHR